MSLIHHIHLMGHHYTKQIRGEEKYNYTTRTSYTLPPTITNDDDFIDIVKSAGLQKYFNPNEIQQFWDLYTEIKNGGAYFEITDSNTVFGGSIVKYTGSFRQFCCYDYKMDKTKKNYYHFDKKVSERKFYLGTSVKWLPGYSGATALCKAKPVEKEKKIPKDMFGYDMEIGTPVVFYYLSYYKTNSLMKLGVIKSISNAGVVTVSYNEEGKNCQYNVRRTKNDLIVVTDDLYNRILFHKLSS